MSVWKGAQYHSLLGKCNQNHSDIACHIHYDGNYQKNKIVTLIGKNMEKSKLCNADGIAKYFSCFVEQSGSLSKN